MCVSVCERCEVRIAGRGIEDGAERLSCLRRRGMITIPLVNGCVILSGCLSSRTQEWPAVSMHVAEGR